MDEAGLAPARDPAEAVGLAVPTQLETKNVSLADWLRAAAAARQDQRPDAARAILEAAAARFPEEPQIAHDLARLAEARRDWLEAEQYWRAFARLRPSAWWGATQIANALREQGKTPEAEAVLAAAMVRFPNESKVFISHARLADMQGDWTEARERWGVVATRFPAIWEGLGGEARALRQLGQQEAAHALLIRALERFPSERGPIHDLARLAESIRDWLAAERWWRIWIALEPASWWGFAGLAKALHEQGQPNEAEATLAAQLDRFVHEPTLAIEYARLAETQGTWADAEKRWADVARRFPHRSEGWIGRAKALRAMGRPLEAKTVLEQTNERFPTMRGPLHDLARYAESVQNWPGAERWWRALLALDSGSARATTSLAVALREQGRFDEAEALLIATPTGLPHDVEAFVAYARIAEARLDWQQAFQRWSAVVDRFPDVSHGHHGLAMVLARLGRWEEADSLLQAATQRFPRDLASLRGFVFLAQRRGDWSAMLDRCALLLDRFPDDWAAHHGTATALRQLQRTGEANAVLQAALDRFPQETGLLNELAREAERQRDWPAAEQWWRRSHEVEPGGWTAQAGLANALLEQKQIEQGLSILRQVYDTHHEDRVCLSTVATSAFAHARSLTDPWLDRLETDVARAVQAGNAPPSVWLAHGTIAKRRERFPDYRTRMEEASERYPNDYAIKQALFDARELHLRDEDITAEPTAISPGQQDEDDAQIITQFESLGGGGNRGGCEFGLVQRGYSLEPLSLLRWASIEPGRLAELLENRFDGLGHPDTIQIRAQGHYDWGFIDRRYEIRMDHTHLSQATVDEPKARRMMIQRMQFLSRKLAGDLELGEKIFIYRIAGDTIPAGAVTRLIQAVTSYGPGRLVVVDEREAPDPIFEPRPAGPSCLVITRNVFDNSKWGSSAFAINQNWLKICRAAMEHFATG